MGTELQAAMDKAEGHVEAENQVVEQQASRLDQSGHLSSRGSNNQRKDCSEWNGVLCTNHQGGHMILFNLQGLQFMGGVTSNEADPKKVPNKQQEKQVVGRQKQDTPETLAPSTPAPVPQLVAPPLDPAVRKRKLTFEAFDQGPQGPAVERRPVKRARSFSEKEPENRPDQPQIDSSCNGGILQQEDSTVPLSSQFCNDILFPALVSQQMPQLQHWVRLAKEDAQAYKIEAERSKLLATPSPNINQDYHLKGQPAATSNIATRVNNPPPAIGGVTGKGGDQSARSDVTRADDVD